MSIQRSRPTQVSLLGVYASVLGAGLVLALALTAVLAAGGGEAAAGFIVVCTIANVPEPEFPRVLTTVALEPIPLSVLAAVAAGYGFGLQALARQNRSRVVPRWRRVCFFLGIILAVVTVFGPLAAYSRTFLSAHMAQHFILVAIAPPLLLLGAPMTLWLTVAGSRRRKRWIYPLLHSKPVAAATHPVVGVGLFVLVPVAWYITPLFAASLDNTLLHYVGYGLFLFAGLHYWWPVVGANPSRWTLPHPLRVLYLFALVPIHAFLGSLFYEPSQVLYDELAAVNRSWGPSPLLDQQIAGTMMFVVGEMLGLIATLAAAVAWSRADEREARRLDARLERKRQTAGGGTK